MAATIHLNHEKLAAYRRLADIKTDKDLAQRLGMDPASISRILNGTQAPGATFIASICDVFGKDLFADLFDVASDNPEEAA